MARAAAAAAEQQQPQKKFSISQPKTAFLPSYPPLSLAAPSQTSFSYPILYNDNQISEYILGHKYTLLNSNVCSLHRNYELVKELATELNTSFIVLTEIWQVDPNFYKIPNYHIAEMKLRQKKRGGGVAIFTSQKLPKPKLYEPLNKNYENIECIAIQTSYDKTDLIICGIYKPPEKSFPGFLKDLRFILQNLANSRKKFIIAGDMNVNLLEQNANSTAYQDLLDEFQVKQLVKGPTRITPTTRTNLDHIASNLEYISAHPTYHRISDHQAVVAAFKETKKHFYKNKSVQNKKIILDEDKSIYNITSFDWTQWMQQQENIDIDSMSENFLKVLEDLMTFKVVKKGPKSPKKPWFSKELILQKDLVAKKNRKFLKNQNEKNEFDFKLEKKSYNDNLKLAQKKYYVEKIEKAGNSSRAIWATINEALSRKKKEHKSTKKIIFEGIEYTKDFDIAQIFNSHFKESAFKIAKNIQDGPDFKSFLLKKNECSVKMDLKETSAAETYELIKSLSNKKSSGFDKISSNLIKSCNLSLCKPITQLINKSFSQGIFPSNLKIGKLTPLHKRDEMSNVANFRPISQLSCISTIIEKTIKEQIKMHHKEHNVISKYQSGFRESHGTVHSLLSARAIIEKELQQKKIVCLVSFDLEKAFDIIDCDKILPYKYEFYGLSSKATSYLHSFFNSRKQYVSFNNTNSDLINLHNISVTQGSTLGPSSFNVYINELPLITKHCQTVMFADDSSFIFSSKSESELNQNINDDLTKILSYMHANKLSVNVNKCKYMIFKPIGKKKSSVKISVNLKGTILEEVSSLKFLGCFLDNNLSFKPHINHVLDKLRSGIAALKLCRNLLNYRCKIMIYNSLFKCHIDYCAILWHSKLNKTQTALITRLQKKAIRLVFSARWNVHTAKLFSISNTTPLEKIFAKESLLFIKKHQNHELPSIFSDFLGPPEIFLKGEKQITKYRSEKTGYKIDIPKEYKKGHIFHDILTEWNNTEEDIRAPSKVVTTKNKLKKITKEKLDAFNCTRKQCYMCGLDKFRDYEKYTKF